MTFVGHFKLVNSFINTYSLTSCLSTVVEHSPDRFRLTENFFYHRKKYFHSKTETTTHTHTHIDVTAFVSFGDQPCVVNCPPM